jgi:fatty acid desaturase
VGRSGAGYLASQVIFALVAFHGFAVLHECGHGACSTSALVNTVTGLVASTLCGLPYFAWKYAHSEHHAWAGNVARDPALALVRAYRRPTSATRWIVELGWRTGVPLLGFLQQLVFWAYTATMSMSRFDWAKMGRCIASTAFLVVVYATLHVAWPSLFCVRNFALGVTLYLVLIEIVNFPHHIGRERLDNGDRRLPLWEQWRVTRSCYYAPGWAEILLLNFNFHIEHHLFPDLPWHQLRRARDLVRNELGARYVESIGASWTWAHRWRSPNLALEGAAQKPDAEPISLGQQ